MDLPAERGKQIQPRMRLPLQQNRDVVANCPPATADRGAEAVSGGDLRGTRSSCAASCSMSYRAGSSGFALGHRDLLVTHKIPLHSADCRPLIRLGGLDATHAVSKRLRPLKTRSVRRASGFVQTRQGQAIHWRRGRHLGFPSLRVRKRPSGKRRLRPEQRPWLPIMNNKATLPRWPSGPSPPSMPLSFDGNNTPPRTPL